MPYDTISLEKTGDDEFAFMVKDTKYMESPMQMFGPMSREEATTNLRDLAIVPDDELQRLFDQSEKTYEQQRAKE